MSTDSSNLGRRRWLGLSSFSLAGVAAPWLLKEDGLLAADVNAALEKPELEPVIHDLLPKAPPREPRAQARGFSAPRREPYATPSPGNPAHRQQPLR